MSQEAGHTACFFPKVWESKFSLKKKKSKGHVRVVNKLKNEGMGECGFPGCSLDPAV